MLPRVPGYAVVGTALTGTAALEQVESAKPDLVRFAAARDVTPGGRAPRTPTIGGWGRGWSEPG
jgi:hypothetical protein